MAAEGKLKLNAPFVAATGAWFAVPNGDPTAELVPNVVEALLGKANGCEAGAELGFV